jgi:hypothetical protein
MHQGAEGHETPQKEVAAFRRHVHVVAKQENNETRRQLSSRKDAAVWLIIGVESLSLKLLGRSIGQLKGLRKSAT